MDERLHGEPTLATLYSFHNGASQKAFKARRFTCAVAVVGLHTAVMRVHIYRRRKEQLQRKQRAALRSAATRRPQRFVWV